MAPSGHMRAVMSQQVMLSITTTCMSWCGLGHNITLNSVCGVDIALPRLSSIPLNSFSARHSNSTLVYSLFYPSCLLLLSFLSAAISFLNNTYRYNPLTFNVFTAFSSSPSPLTNTPPSKSYPARAMGHEISGANSYFRCAIPGLHLALQALIDYKGN